MTSSPDQSFGVSGTGAARLPLPPDSLPEQLVNLARLLGRAAAHEFGHAVTDPQST